MMLLGRIARAANGRPDRPLDGLRATGISTDTRTLRAGDLYFALRGGRFDGHDFLGDAFARGACGAVVDHAVPAPGPLLVVEDTTRALGELASAYRMTLGARVVGVGGSNGKTTTKEMIAHILGRDRRVVKAQGSFNNQVGVPLTIFSATEETEVAVLEVGTNHPGEMARLGAVARPDLAVLVSVGAEHLEGLGSLDGVADEECSFLDHLRGGGSAVVHHDPRILSRVKLPPGRVTTFGLGPEADLHPDSVSGSSFVVRGVPFRLALLGEWNVQNALAAAAACTALGVPLEECARRLLDFRGPKMRMERLDLGGVTIINDAYNSNPESAVRAVREFSRLDGGARRVAVIGDMRELGETSETYHRDLGRQLAESPVDVVVGVGRDCRWLLEEVRGRKEAYGFSSVDEVRTALDRLVRPGDLVLLKGSRSMALERVVKWVGDRMSA
jgi:UDP-N-acetylmuramoyl-tripeptide--D-alanyl-D-alanine ligase